MKYCAKHLRLQKHEITVHSDFLIKFQTPKMVGVFLFNANQESKYKWYQDPTEQQISEIDQQHD